jgi:hypothetical protein
MSQEFETLPEAVRRALQRGQILDAIGLLREAKGISPKAARSRIEGLVAKGIPTASSSPPASTFPPPEPGQQGRAGLGAVIFRLLGALQEAERKRQVSSDVAPQRYEPGSLAPGEQPRSAEFGGWLVIALLAVGAVFLYQQFR